MVSAVLKHLRPEFLGDDLNDHPVAVFAAGENYVSDGERAWLRWVKNVEKLLGHSLDGDQDTDGYSLDIAHDEFMNGLTPKEYAAEAYDSARAARRMVRS